MVAFIFRGGVGSCMGGWRNFSRVWRDFVEIKGKLLRSWIRVRDGRLDWSLEGFGVKGIERWFSLLRWKGIFLRKEEVVWFSFLFFVLFDLSFFKR